MKGDVKRKCFPADGPSRRNSVMTASPASVARVLMFRFDTSRSGSSPPQGSVGSELKSGAVDEPTIVLFEPSKANAFPGRARGDRVRVGLLATAMDHPPRGSSPSSLRSEPDADDDLFE